VPPGDTPADPRDGTRMTIHRVVLPPAREPAVPAAAGGPGPVTEEPGRRPAGGSRGVAPPRQHGPAPGRQEPGRRPAEGSRGVPPPGQHGPGPVTEEPGRRPAEGSRGVTPPGQHGPGPVWPRLSPLAEVYAALVTGVRDYVVKNGFGSVILALSGGIDSALTATIAADAVGPERVHVVLMPSRYSSGHSVSDAEDLVKRQGLHARTAPIQPMVDAFQAELGLRGLAAENLQARVRGVILMGLSNAEGHLALTTGNKSELATGYST